MDHCSHGLSIAARVALLVFIGCGGASVLAGYAQLAPPSGWASGTGAGGMMRGAANDALGGGWRGTSGVLNAGGRQVSMPAAYRFAGNAGRYAARGFALNPWLLGAAGIAWLAEECIAYKGGSFQLTCGAGMPPQSNGYRYRGANAMVWKNSLREAALSEAAHMVGLTGWVSIVPGECTEVIANSSWGCAGTFQRVPGGAVEQGNLVVQGTSSVNSDCPAGWYVTPAGCVQTAPPKTLTPKEVEDIMAPKTVPDLVPREIPDIPLPIELPKINPVPFPNGDPQPLVIPQGDPVPVPNSDPKRWTQPEIEVTPRPSTDSPWRVDIRPQDRPVPDPVTTPPKVDPWTPPPPIPNDPPVPNPPVPRTPDMCEKNPGALACADLDTPDGSDLKTEDRGGPITPDSGWGGEDASCPAPRKLSTAGGVIEIPFDLFCTYMHGIRPIVIAMAWLSAGFILLGARGGDD